MESESNFQTGELSSIEVSAELQKVGNLTEAQVNDLIPELASAEGNVRVSLSESDTKQAGVPCYVVNGPNNEEGHPSFTYLVVVKAPGNIDVEDHTQ
ncbi:hypothetical protein ACFLZH_03310 [Patescibacteria group bacterium]